MPADAVDPPADGGHPAGQHQPAKPALDPHPTRHRHHPGHHDRGRTGRMALTTPRGRPLVEGGARSCGVIAGVMFGIDRPRPVRGSSRRQLGVKASIWLAESRPSSRRPRPGTPTPRGPHRRPFQLRPSLAVKLKPHQLPASIASPRSPPCPADASSATMSAGHLVASVHQTQATGAHRLPGRPGNQLVEGDPQGDTRRHGRRVHDPPGAPGVAQ